MCTRHRHNKKQQQIAIAITAACRSIASSAQRIFSLLSKRLHSSRNVDFEADACGGCARWLAL